MANAATVRRHDPRPGDADVQSFARGLAVICSFSAAAPEQTLREVAVRAVFY